MVVNFNSSSGDGLGISVYRNVFVLALCALALSGCVGMNKVTGGTAALGTEIATRIHAECRNEQPGGPCVEDSRISTKEKNRWAADLRVAEGLTRQAHRLKVQGSKAEAQGKLAQVDIILKTLEDILISMGVK